MGNIGLYNINSEMMSLVNDVMDQDGEITEDQIQQLEILRENLEPSVLRYDGIIKFLKSQEELAQKEIARLTKYAKRNEQLQEKLEGALLQALLLFGEDDKLTPKQIKEDKEPIRRLEIGTVKLSTRKSVSTEILDEDEIPLHLCKIEAKVILFTEDNINEFKEMYPSGDIIITPEKTEIKKAINNKIEVKGAELLTKFGLTIK